MKNQTLTVALALFVFTCASSAVAGGKKCFWVNSYHVGYEWSDGIGRGLTETLKGKCKLETFYMDSKRNNVKDFIVKKGEEARAWVEAGKPDVLILSDDNSEAQVLPAFKNSKLPVVFCGLNWTIDQYGLPFKNTTGMIEVAPVQPLAQELRRAMPAIKTMAFVSNDNETERKDFAQISKLMRATGIELKAYFATDWESWKSQVAAAHKEDFIYLSNNAGVKDWVEETAREWHAQNLHKISGTTYSWMSPYVAFAMAKSPVEQGHYAGHAVVQILDGRDPAKIQVATNSSYDSIINPHIYEHASMKLSREFLAKAKPLSK